MKLWLIGAVVVAVASTLPFDVEAKRMGGGKSSGMQRDMPARTSPDAAPGKPAQSQQAAPNTPAAANAAGTAAPKRNWMGPLAGLAAGLGIAALLSHLGLGEGMANIVMMLLIAAVAFFVIRFLLRRFGGGAVAGRQPALAGAAAGAGPGAATGPGSPGWQYVDERPGMQRTALNQETAFEPASQPSNSAPQGQDNGSQVTRAFVPAAFDSEGFSRIAKMIFIRLQAANDTADLDDLRRFTTPELFASLRLDIQERGDAPQHTDVARVDTEVLDVVNESDRQIVSVRFHGEVIEEKGAAPTAFNEVWHLVKPHDDSRQWAIAGIEQMN